MTGTTILRTHIFVSHIWIWLVNYLHLHLHLQAEGVNHLVVHLVISFGHHILSEIIFLTLGSPLLPPRAVPARTTFPPSYPDSGSAPRAHADREHRWRHSKLFTFTFTSNTCGLNARVSWAWEAHWRLSFSGMTSLGRVLDLIMQQRCCLQRFLLIVPLLCQWPPQLQCLAPVAAFLLGVSTAACTRLPPSALLLASLHLPAWSPSTRGCSACSSVLCLPRRCSLRLLLFCTCPPLCAGALWLMPAWVWRDVQFFCGATHAHRVWIVFCVTAVMHAGCHSVACQPSVKSSVAPLPMYQSKWHCP